MPRKTKMMQKWDSLSERAQKISKLVSATIVVVGFVVSCCSWGVGEIDKAIDSHIAHLETQITANSQEIKTFRAENEMRESRMELMNLIADYPDNVDDVLKAAEHYFVDLKGDYVADKAFEDWAAKHGVNSDYILNKR